MITFEEALTIVQNAVFYEVNSENVPLDKSLNRVLAQDVFSDINLPPFNKSAMDGYACREEDIFEELEVLEVISAGKPPSKIVGPKQCAKIMTGAMMPEGADCVLKVEETEEVSEGFIRFTGKQTKSNFVEFAHDVKEGDLVLKKGTIIKPQHFAVAATVGLTEPRVFKKIRVGVISTGDELVEPQDKPKLSQIRNSNAYQLIGQLLKMNVTPYYFGIARDNEESTSRIISKAMNESDVILLSGGVSMGDFDFIPKILNQLGVDIKFKTIAIQPGKPTVFGVLKDKFVFGLPGNPVSSFNIFELLAKPLIYRLMGHSYEPALIRIPMGMDYTRKKSSRKSFIPIKVEDAKVWPIDYHGSAHINALSDAFGIISIPVGISELKEGELVDVRQL
ncbi:MAG: molybdopterin molybdenumtransferase MoeA [Bacteroidetes bacterium HGW-Bacteroidetes-17]|jgi:molybdopterin molybdotransferase|nr:MAG: molybdopterin molybdenumtransferase MoeA [Bacteroidetes bacterium HGW-Bacteroidetes-17]